METQLSKTGGTPYRCAGARSLVEKGLSVPLSALNSLRRQVLDELTAQRSAPPQRRQGEYKAESGMKTAASRRWSPSACAGLPSSPSNCRS